MKYSAFVLGAMIGGASFGAVNGSETPLDHLAALQASEPNYGDWCDSLQDLGKIHSDKESPWIQKVKLFGRYHHQWTYTDGSYTNNARGRRNFSGTSQELRRFRVGASVDFLQRWTLSARLNLENGNVNDNHIHHENLDEWSLTYRADDLGVFKDPTISYGLVKVNFGGEWYSSSKKIKTVERSNLSNFYSPDRATGATFTAEVSNFDLTFGVYSTREQGYFSGDWDGGQAYFGRVKTEVAGGDLRADVLYVEAKGNEDQVFGFDWAGSLTYDRDMGGWDLFTNVTYGSDEDGDTYGLVIMPSAFILEDRLEAVFRYQWAHSTGNTIRPGSGSHTSVRTAASAHNIEIAKGNDNHTFYAGLNYHLCDHNAKLMAGIEYETLSGDNTDTEATTVWGAVRFYF